MLDYPLLKTEEIKVNSGKIILYSCKTPMFMLLVNFMTVCGTLVTTCVMDFYYYSFVPTCAEGKIRILQDSLKRSIVAFPEAT